MKKPLSLTLAPRCAAGRGNRTRIAVLEYSVDMNRAGCHSLSSIWNGGEGWGEAVLLKATNHFVFPFSGMIWSGFGGTNWGLGTIRIPATPPLSLALSPRCAAGRGNRTRVAVLEYSVDMNRAGRHSLSSIWNGGEGWGEEALLKTINHCKFPFLRIIWSGFGEINR